MNNLTNSIKLFVNKDSLTSIINGIFSIIRGPLMMILISFYISEEIQGFWYTITSLSALSTFADLGFGTLVSQFSAHEFSKMSFNDKKEFVGKEESIQKIASLFRYVIKWALCVCVIAYPIIMIIGSCILNTHGNVKIWIVPWLIYMGTGGFSFIVRIIMAFFEGCGQIYKNQTNIIVSNIILTIVQIVLLVLGANLYALAIPSFIAMISNFIMLFIMYHKSMGQLIKCKTKTNYHWGKNFLSLIWKYALSWAGGYFVFQIYTPLAFMLYDPVLAGKVGISMTLVQACFNLSNTFVNILVPKINMAVALRDYNKAKTLVKKGTIASMSIYIAGSFVVLMVLAFGQGGWEFLDKILVRFLDVKTISVLFVAWLLQMPINSIAIYGRAHKQEPFLIPSIIGSLCVLGSTLLITHYLPITYIFLGFAITNFITVFVFAIMYVKLNKKWAIKLETMQDENKKLEHNKIEEQNN